MESVRDFFFSIQGWGGYVFLFFSSLGENLFPPMPGDTFIVLGAFMVGRGQLQFLPAYVAATAGSASGFMILYAVGRKWGRRFFHGKKGKIFQSERLERIESWFDRYGYLVIGINRFLSGFRALVSFAAGMAKMDAWIVLGLGLTSILVWNALLMGMGVWVGEHWSIILRHYQIIVFVLIGIVILVWLVRSRFKK